MSRPSSVAGLLGLAALLSAGGCGCSRPTSDAAAVYRTVAPSIAFIRTPSAFGSGVVLEGGVIVTNAHVVWPYAEARVSFPGESVSTNMTVTALDVVADLALLGPVSGRPALALAADAETVPIGSRVFLIGYPGEVDDFPKPTLTAGVLSRLREARFADLTFLQADVTIVGGQSGGALVAADGRVLGISGLSGIGERTFALVLSAQDVIQRVQAMRTAPGPMLRTRMDPPSNTHPLHVTGAWGQQVFVTELAEDQAFKLDVEGSGDVSVRGPDGEELELDDGTFKARVGGAHFVIATVAEGQTEATGVVHSDVALSALEDPDDERVVSLGTTVEGALDFPTDVDRYVLDLEQGQHVHVRVDGVLDVRAGVDFEVGSEKPLASAVAAEGGLGLSADLEFTAPKTARYYLAVDESEPEGPAGYQVVVEAKRPQRQKDPQRSLFAR